VRPGQVRRTRYPSGRRPCQPRPRRSCCWRRQAIRTWRPRCLGTREIDRPALGSTTTSLAPSNSVFVRTSLHRTATTARRAGPSAPSAADRTVRLRPPDDLSAGTAQIAMALACRLYTVRLCTLTFGGFVVQRSAPDGHVAAHPHRSSSARRGPCDQGSAVVRLERQRRGRDPDQRHPLPAPRPLRATTWCPPGTDPAGTVNKPRRLGSGRTLQTVGHVDDFLPVRRTRRASATGDRCAPFGRTGRHRSRRRPARGAGQPS
jgi:hypothetical protein